MGLLGPAQDNGPVVAPRLVIAFLFLLNDAALVLLRFILRGEDYEIQCGQPLFRASSTRSGKTSPTLLIHASLKPKLDRGPRQAVLDRLDLEVRERHAQHVLQLLLVGVMDRTPARVAGCERVAEAEDAQLRTG